MFLVSGTPKVSILTHLCRYPFGALGVSKYDGGVQGFVAALGLTVDACDLTFVESL
jgi:hypothetical protein